MKLQMLVLAATIGLAGCEVHHIHHFEKGQLPGCNCDSSAAMGSGYNLPLSYDKDVTILPPVYQPISPYANPYPPMAAPRPAPKVEMPEYFKLTPVEPGQMNQGQQQAMPQTNQPMSYSPYQQAPQQQPVMPIQMSSNSKGNDSNIKTYLFQPAGGVVYQY